MLKIYNNNHIFQLDNSSMTDIHGSTNLPLPSEEVAMEIEIESTMVRLFLISLYYGN